jgi:hypothetical protein
MLAPVAHRGWWIFCGLLLQIAGVGGPLVHVLTKARHEDIGGVVSVATFRLAWHESLHARAGVLLPAAGTAVFVAGCVLLARPFVRRRRTLLIAVPLAAVVGVLVAGVAAIVVALVVVAFESGGSGGGGGGGVGNLDFDLPSGSKRRARRQNVG